MIGILFWLCVLMIFYAYLGYMLFLFVMARFWPISMYESENLPAVTLLIAAYNEEQIIESKLENALSLDYPRERLQILVAADGSDDRTVEIVNQFVDRGIEISFDVARRGKMAAINHAMQLVRNEIVVFSDANNFYTSDSLTELVKPFSDRKVGGVSGSKTVSAEQSLLGDADSLYWKYESIIKELETRLGCTPGVSGEIFGIRRNLFVPPPAEVINDDMYIALSIIRAGYDIVYVPTAYSYERMALTEGDEVVRRTRIFAGLYQTMRMSLSVLPFDRPLIMWQIISHKYLRALVPLAMIGALIANVTALFFTNNSSEPAWLFLASPYALLFFILQACFYLLAFLGKRLNLKGTLGRILYLPAFLVNSNIAALLGLQRYLTGRQTVLWKKASR